MKLTVKKPFRDKTDHVTVYRPQEVIDVEDPVRAQDLINRGLCAAQETATGTSDAEGPEEEPSGTVSKKRKKS